MPNSLKKKNFQAIMMFKIPISTHCSKLPFFVQKLNFTLCLHFQLFVDIGNNFGLFGQKIEFCHSVYLHILDMSHKMRAKRMNRPWKWCRSLSRFFFRPNFDPIESEKWALKRLTEELRMMSIKLVTQGHRKKEMLFAWGWGPSVAKLFCEWLRKKNWVLSS